MAEIKEYEESGKRVVEIVNSGWKLVGSKTDTTELALPSSFDELLVVARISAVYLPINIPKQQLTTAVRYFGSGYYQTSSSNCASEIKVSLSFVAVSQMHLNGSARTSNYGITVYYK